MVEATKIVTFDSAHRLLNHPGKCRSLHGHTYKLEVTFQAQELQNGMVYDFGDMKKVL
ncbi:MAG: 6-carboxytetrahydropterin synthase, partial [Desulfobacteraceae bacterium]|nr:6-carboxytetrahydropterin synthase [Desulfobacteraceae bacterium]